MSNDTFQWTPELVKEYAKRLYTEYFPMDLDESMKLFKQSKMPKKEWEIVEFRNPYNLPIVPNANGEWHIPILANDSPASYKEVLEAASFKGGNKIHAVRRLSDNEVFTVGDDVASINSGGSYKITGFLIKPDDMMADLGGHGCVFLKYLYKMPQPKKERIAVTNASTRDTEMTFYFNGLIPKGKYTELKGAIERILNEDDPFEKYYNYSGQEKAFNAAREILAKDTHPRYTMEKYPTFQDYLNSKK